MNLKLHISTCPNDTFMFEALLHGRVDTEGLTFEVTLSDIEELNRGVQAGTVDVSKMSYALLPAVCDRYAVLRSGSALGRGNGPLLVARPGMKLDVLRGASVAVPGLHTTGCLLLRRFFPEVGEVRSCLFNAVVGEVLAGEAQAGVLIHEERFTYAKKGLVMLADLGTEWERETGCPLPLGAIVVSRALPREVQQRVDRVVRRSVTYALEHPLVSRAFVRKYAQELSDTVIESHIRLFVNDFSVELGPEGIHAVQQFLTPTPDQNSILTKVSTPSQNQNLISTLSLNREEPVSRTIFVEGSCL